MDSPLLNAALEYAGYGWHVVRLHHVKDNGSCSCRAGADCSANSRGKHPIDSGWQNLATTDEETICSWWEQTPLANIGILLGPKSGIIDIEFDDEEGRAFADQVLRECFTPTYSSGRSVHRFFRYTTDLPAITVPKINGLEFRLGQSDRGAQSVAPPSLHHSGKRYQWLPGLSPSEVEVADIPPHILRMLQNPELNTKVIESRKSRQQSKFFTQDKVLETVDGRDDTIYREACRMWREKQLAYGAAILDDPDTQGQIYTTLWALNLHKCSPPIEEGVVHQKVESARKFISGAADKETESRGLQLTGLGLERREGEWFPGQWSLTVVHSDPPRYLLHVPAFTEMCGGTVTIPLEDFDDPPKVARLVLAATKSVVLNDQPGRWAAIWNGTKGSKNNKGQRGLKAKLMDRAKHEQSISDEKRSVIVADILGERIEKAVTAPSPDPRGRPTRLEDGTIWIRWEKFWSEFTKFGDVTQKEVAQLARSIGITRGDSKQWVAPGETARRRYIVLNTRHLYRLEEERDASDNSQKSVV